MPVTFQSTELSPEDKHILFIKELLKYSDNKDDPVSDWEFNGIVTELDDDDVFNCICSTRIKYQYRIHKKNDNKVFIEIGCECIKRWLDPSITCDDCSGALGSVMKRMKTSDYLCRECKKKREEKRAHQKLIRDMEQFQLDSKLYYQHLREVENEKHEINRIEYLGNLYYQDDIITLRKLKDILDDEKMVLSIVQRTRQPDVMEYFSYYYTIT